MSVNTGRSILMTITILFYTSMAAWAQGSVAIEKARRLAGAAIPFVAGRRITARFAPPRDWAMMPPRNLSTKSKNCYRGRRLFRSGPPNAKNTMEQKTDGAPASVATKESAGALIPNN